MAEPHTKLCKVNAFKSLNFGMIDETRRCIAVDDSGTLCDMIASPQSCQPGHIYCQMHREKLIHSSYNCDFSDCINLFLVGRKLNPHVMTLGQIENFLINNFLIKRFPRKDIENYERSYLRSCHYYTNELKNEINHIIQIENSLRNNLKRQMEEKIQQEMQNIREMVQQGHVSYTTDFRFIGSIVSKSPPESVITTTSSTEISLVNSTVIPPSIETPPSTESSSITEIPSSTESSSSTETPLSTVTPPSTGQRSEINLDKKIVKKHFEVFISDVDQELNFELSDQEKQYILSVIMVEMQQRLLCRTRKLISAITK